MVGLQYAYRFHTRVAAGNYKSRIRIYSIDLAQNPIDIQNPNEVEAYADLLKYKNIDTDSNGRIGQKGIKINNYYNKNEQIEIGDAVSCNIEIPLINDDGYFTSYDWDQTVIIYWDLWEELNSTWLTCPLGVYFWERPTKTNDVVVVAKANDAMSAIFGNFVPGIVFPSLEDERWENGIPLYYFYNQIVSNTSGVIPDASIQNVPNMTVQYYRPPFDPSSMTKRDVLAWMAGVCGGIAYISRDGTPKIKFFSDAYYQEFPMGPKYYYTLDGDAGPTPIVKIDIGEYTVPQIDKLIAMVGQNGNTYTAGSGTNALYSINNGFLATYSLSAQLIVNKMYDVVSGTDASSDIVPYNPISLRAYSDPSVEAGDIIRVVRGGVTYAMPIFQQTLYWRGTDWFADLMNSGFEKRRIPSSVERQGYKETADINTAINSSVKSATIDSSGLETFKNGSGETVFTLQLPIYNGGVS
jgi:hypothetical protein